MNIKKIDKIAKKYRNEKSMELFNTSLQELSISQSLQLDRYINDITNPEWKQIYLDNSTYCFVSNVGTVKDSNNKELKIYKNDSGYSTVCIRSFVNPKECYRKMVHRLVAEAFVDNPGNKPEVNHLDNNPSNNWYENLQWVTRKENIKYTIESGNQVVGSAHKKSKYNDDQIRRVCKMLENPNAIINDISRETGVSVRTITHIRFDNGWHHISKDYNIKVPKRKSGPRYSELSLHIKESLVQGKTTKEIIDDLNNSGLRSGISDKSIFDRIYNIRKKLL